MVIERLVSLAVLIAGPFLFLGVILRVKAVWVGRKGPPLLQPLHDFVRLARKGRVVSRVATRVFSMAPTIGLAAVFTAGLATPMAGGGAILPMEGDFLVFASMLAVNRFWLMLAAMDTGSSFEGMGASREGFFASILEPGLFLVLASISMFRGSVSFSDMLRPSTWPGGTVDVAFALCILTLFIMLLVEGCRVPVDDPETHLELTMIHEVMVLDHSGPDLAFIQYASGMKMVVIGALMSNLVLPSGLAPLAAVASLAGFLAALAVAVGLTESLSARLRLDHVPQFVFFMTANALVVLAILLLVRFGSLS